MPTKSIYQLKVTIRGSKPPIWRRILVPENINLFDLHEIIQRVMGWENYHLHMFEIDGQIYGDPEDDKFGSVGTKNETRYRMNQLGLREKSKFSYKYDFGDNWEHTILVEQIMPALPGTYYPVCASGKRACPPEDCGGIWGYAHFLDAIANPEHEDHAEMLEWIGGGFDPDEFDLNEVNEALQSIKPKRARNKAQRALETEEDFENGFMAPSAEEQKNQRGSPG